MAIPEEEKRSHEAWIAGLKKIPQKKCLVAPKTERG